MNIDSIKINRNPKLDEEVSNKKYNDDELDENTIVIIKHCKFISKYLLVMIHII